ncbi:MAG: allophanate hydrolase [Oceanospirillaceae bacterium]|nr:allophanate hydrolase [Oceanospirillaceae bacterium]
MAVGMTEVTTGIGWNLNDWGRAYRNGADARGLLLSTRNAIAADELDANGLPRRGSAWIALASEEQLTKQISYLESLKASAEEEGTVLPLYGVPFAVKDNIDAADFHTTAACPEYAYEPDDDAFVVQLLRKAGAIVMGKTNLDQFATGLVGTRSPYGAVNNAFNPDYISGGSSSGSATAVAKGQVAFSLGTDTAGSGRVPAGFNHIVGLKATVGAISASGVVPACRSLDCVSVFALNTRDAERIYEVAAQYDEADGYARSRTMVRNERIQTLGIPAGAPWFGDEVQKAAYDKACDQAVNAGFELVEVDFTPMFELASLLYQGPWVAERYAAVGEFLKQDLPGINPVVKSIIAGGTEGTAVDAFKAEYRRKDLARKIQGVFKHVDALFVPTTPRFPSSADVESAPVEVNSQLGTYTNFVNLADLCALALPAHMREDGLPFGVTLIAPAWHELALTNFAGQWQSSLRLPEAPVMLGQKEDASVVVAVVGAHLTGMPLNHQLTSRHATLLEQTLTAKKYKLYALANTVPPKPGLVRLSESELERDAQAGHQLIVELWRLDQAAFGSFVEEIPQPLGIGTLELEDGRLVKGFICEPEAVASATDISHLGGWRAYISSLNS